MTKDDIRQNFFLIVLSFTSWLCCGPERLKKVIVIEQLQWSKMDQQRYWSKPLFFGCSNHWPSSSYVPHPSAHQIRFPCHLAWTTIHRHTRGVSVHRRKENPLVQHSLLSRACFFTLLVTALEMFAGRKQNTKYLDETYFCSAMSQRNLAKATNRQTEPTCMLTVLKSFFIGPQTLSSRGLITLPKTQRSPPKLELWFYKNYQTLSRFLDLGSAKRKTEIKKESKFSKYCMNF